MKKTGQGTRCHQKQIRRGQNKRASLLAEQTVDMKNKKYYEE